ncbi:MFS transporter [Cohnella endophytica]|uniref:MFS transporter n=1 Tax=Cohnella endophytica TaxID=2419778 RepID=A0A494XG92_9BACL|nr:MFS transporter [Cohnella endophytica]RKP48862.1 MFS transporter [Cohnella endophytica]
MTAYLLDLLRLPVGVRRFLMTEALYGIGIGMYALVLNLHLLSQGLRENEIGTLASVGILIMGVSAIPVSLLARRMGRKRLLVAGILFIAAGNAFYASSGNLLGFFAAQTLVSVGLTLVETTETQLLFHYCSSRQDETRAYSLMFAVFTAFAGAGTLAAGNISVVMATGGGYRNQLLLACLVLLVLGTIRGLWLPSEKRTSSEKANLRKTERLKLKGKLPGKTIWLFSSFLALLGGAFALTGSFLNVIVKFRLDWTDDKMSLLLAANGLILFFCSLLTPYVSERFGQSASLTFAFIGNVLFFGLLYCQFPTTIFLFLFLMRGGGTTMLSNLADSQLMSTFEDRERDLFAGMRSVFRSVGSSGATLLAGRLLAGRDYRTPFLLTAIALSLAFVFYSLWVRPRLSAGSRSNDSRIRE